MDEPQRERGPESYFGAGIGGGGGLLIAGGMPGGPRSPAPGVPSVATVTEPAREVPVHEETDVLVVGGGPAVLAANAAAHDDDRAAGPSREGTALLQGLAVCGRCGRRTIRYHTRHGTQIPSYVCQNDGIRTAQPICQQVPQPRVRSSQPRHVIRHGLIGHAPKAPTATAADQVDARRNPACSSAARNPERYPPVNGHHEWNNQVSSFRARVERAVATLKTWRILFTDYRRPLRTFNSSFRAAIGLYFFRESFA